MIHLGTLTSEKKSPRQRMSTHPVTPPPRILRGGTYARQER